MKHYLLFAFIAFLACYTGWFLGSPASRDASCSARYRADVIACGQSAECGTDMDYQDIDDSLLECIGGAR